MKHEPIDPNQIGLTARAEIAMHCLCSMISIEPGRFPKEVITRKAVEIADALIEALNKPTE